MTSQSIFVKGLYIYQVLFLFFPKRRNSMAVEIVSIRSKEPKMRGIIKAKFPLIRSINFPFLDSSNPLASWDIRMVWYSSWMSGI